jgi:hypothetical protein
VRDFERAVELLDKGDPLASNAETALRLRMKKSWGSDEADITPYLDVIWLNFSSTNHSASAFE